MKRRKNLVLFPSARVVCHPTAGPPSSRAFNSAIRHPLHRRPSLFPHPPRSLPSHPRRSLLLRRRHQSPSPRPSPAEAASSGRHRGVSIDGGDGAGGGACRGHVSLVSFLSGRCPAAAASASRLTPFEALLEEEEEEEEEEDRYRVDLAPPPPPPQPPAPLPQEALPMDADEPMEKKDCCILSQDFFWSVPIRALRWSADSMVSVSD
jgi:hypothetical protein